MTNVKRGFLRETLKSFKVFRPEGDLDIQVAEKFFECLDTPLSLALYIMLKHGEYAQLVSYDFDPDREVDANLVRDNLAAVSLLRKYRGFKTSIDTRQKAIDSFLAGEQQCAATNSRFRNPLIDPLFKGINVYLHNAFTRKIEGILGNYKKEDFFSLGSWGPGSTISITGNDTSAVRKFRCERQITSNLYALIKDELPNEYPNWFPNSDSVDKLIPVTCSELLTVHKNAMTDRTIFKESGITTWFQKSLGTSIRRRLMRHGYDLNSTTRSKEVARQGSLDGVSATVDFRNASNTISKLMIRESIRDNVWFTLLDACRTPSYTLDKGKTFHTFEMFSSMGNGFTFELESLIFVAAAEAVHDYLGLGYENITVHGDDITINTEAYDLYRDFCEFLGFTINLTKSFAHSHFRESCGAYYYRGLDVKPLFLKDKSNDAKSIFRLANGINSLAHRYNNSDGRDLRFHQLHLYTVNKLPKALRLYGASIQGDVCIHDDFDVVTPVISGDGLEGYLVPSLIDVPVSLESTSPAVLLARLWYPSKEMSYGNKTNLRVVTRTACKVVFVHQWYNHGPWKSRTRRH